MFHLCIILIMFTIHGTYTSPTKDRFDTIEYIDLDDIKSLVSGLIDRQEHDRSSIDELRNTVTSQELTISSLVEEVSHLQSERSNTAFKMSNMQAQLEVVADLVFSVTEIREQQETIQNDVITAKTAQEKDGAILRSLNDIIKRETTKANGNGNFLRRMSRELTQLNVDVSAQKVEIKELKLNMHKLDKNQWRDAKPKQQNQRPRKPELDLVVGSGAGEELLPFGPSSSTGEVASVEQKLLNQELELAKMQNRLSNVTMQVMKMENVLMAAKQRMMEGNVESVQEMFLNVTQQILSLQQWHVANTGHVNGTEMNRRQIESLMQSSAHMQDKIAILEEALRRDRKVSSHRNKLMVEDIRSMNRTISSAVKNLRQHTNYAIQMHDAFTADFKTLESHTFTIDNRLAHVEVKVLNSSLQECRKHHRDEEQDKRINIAQYGIDNLEARIRRLGRDLRDVRNDIGKVKVNTGKMGNALSMVISHTRNLSAHLPDVIENKVELHKIVRYLPKDCSAEGAKVGGQLIHPDGSKQSIETFCDYDSWTYIQRRTDGAMDFEQDWIGYKHGFGDPANEFWIGNEAIYYLTQQGSYSLYIGMLDTDNNYTYAQYSTFSIEKESGGYRLNIDGYHGNATDALSYSNGMMFSSKDVDNDASSTDCGKHYSSGWWYKHCHYANLNGRFRKGIVWFNYDKEDWSELKQTYMKVKRNS